MNSPLGTPLLDFVFTNLSLAPRDRHNTLIIQRRNNVFPFHHLNDSLIVCLLRTIEHVLLDQFKKLRNGFNDGR